MERHTHTHRERSIAWQTHFGAFGYLMYKKQRNIVGCQISAHLNYLRLSSMRQITNYCWRCHYSSDFINHSGHSF